MSNNQVYGILSNRDKESRMIFNFESANNEYLQGNYQKAVQIHLINAEHEGYAPSENELGNAYGSGQGVEQNFREAAKWYRKAAEHGYVMAQYNLGLCYMHGEGVSQDIKEAFKWLRLAAENGDHYAQHNLGVLYDAEGNHGEAFKWYLKAAEQGNVMSQVNAAISYLNGEGVERNIQAAYQLLLQAADQGSEEARELLGRFGRRD